MIIERGEIRFAVIGVLAFGVRLHAGMMPLSGPEYGYRQPPSVCGPATPQCRDFSYPCGCASGVDLDSLPACLACGSGDDEGQAGEIKGVQILTEERGSLSLCLYALFSVGLYRSAPLVRKLSFGGLLHHQYIDGPGQIGHSFAITPEDLRSTPVYCFWAIHLTQPPTTNGVRSAWHRGPVRHGRPVEPAGRRACPAMPTFGN